MALMLGHKGWTRVAVVVIAGFALLQLWRPAKTNPPSDPALALGAKVTVPPDVSAILERSCADCHSNQTVWPWYSNVSPVAWLVVEDVNAGRKHLNLSTVGKLDPERLGRKLKGICQEITTGEMPLWQYTAIHRGASLDSGQVQQLCAWTEAATTELGPKAANAPAETVHGVVPAPGAPAQLPDAGSSGSISPSPSR